MVHDFVDHDAACHTVQRGSENHTGKETGLKKAIHTVKQRGLLIRPPVARNLRVA